MSKILLLDSGPLGMVTTPKAKSPIYQECKVWFNSLEEKGYTIILPEIADYEVRRELIRANKVVGIQRLDELKAVLIWREFLTYSRKTGDKSNKISSPSIFLSKQR